MNARPRAALAQLALDALMISFSPVFVRLATVGPTVSAFYRMLLGAGSPPDAAGA